MNIKYLDKIPLFKGTTYTLKGKKAKRTDIRDILSRYTFEKDKIYEVIAYNKNFKKYDRSKILDLSLLEAWPICAECAEYRYIFFMNGEICFDYFRIDDCEFIIDVGFVYSDIDLKLGDTVRSILRNEDMRIVLPADAKYDRNREDLISSKVRDNFEFDMHYLYIEEEGWYLMAEVFPVCSLIFKEG